MIPQRRPHQSFASHQAEMATWLGTDVATMNAAHDPLHRSLCAWLGIASVSLTDPDHPLAAIEEQAVLHVQRLIHHAGAATPKETERCA